MKRGVVFLFLLFSILLVIEIGDAENNLDEKVKVIIGVKEEKRIFSLLDKDVAAELAKAGFKKEHRFSSLNAFSGEISKKNLELLKNKHEVEFVEIDHRMKALLQDSVPLINASVVHGLISKHNITGVGETICVLDTGVDYTHTDLGGCTSSQFLAGNCNKIVGGYDYVNSDSNPMDDHGHGTHIAGIVAANGSLIGVAPYANIVAIKVLDKNGGGYESDLIKGIEWCTNNTFRYNISVISMSLGTSLYSSYCDNNFISLTSAINNAIAKNITVVAATGNDYNTTSIASPACIRNVTAVGATDKGDNIAPYTNRNNITDLFAPGSSINSAWINGDYNVASGTSMAAPHISGAIALLNQYLKEENDTILFPSQIINILNKSGKRIHDQGTGLNFSRINIYKSLVSIDHKNPKLTVDSPKNITYIYKRLDLNYTASDLFLDSVWYNLDDTGNITLSTNITLNISKGSHTIYVYTNDSNDNENSSTITFFADLSRPVVTLDTQDNLTDLDGNLSFNCSAEAQDSSFLVNISLYNNISGNFSRNQTISISGTSNSTTFIINQVADNTDLIWNCISYNNNSLLDWGDRNYSVSVKINDAPIITLYSPVNSSVKVNESESLNFTQTSSDPDNDPLTYSWKLDNIEKATTQNYTYSPSYTEAGNHTLLFVISDGTLNSTKKWNITVNDVIVCGNDIKEAGEECDGSDLNEETCVSKGYISGTLFCSSCSFDFGACTSSSSSSGGGSSGGSSSGGTTSVDKKDVVEEKVKKEEKPAPKLENYNKQESENKTIEIKQEPIKKSFLSRVKDFFLNILKKIVHCYLSGT